MKIATTMCVAAMVCGASTDEQMPEKLVWVTPHGRGSVSKVKCRGLGYSPTNGRAPLIGLSYYGTHPLDPTRHLFYGYEEIIQPWRSTIIPIVAGRYEYRWHGRYHETVAPYRSLRSKPLVH